MAALNIPDIDTRPLQFGKYKGQCPNFIGDHDPGYIVWLYETVKPPACSLELYKACDMARLENQQEQEDDRENGLHF